MPLRRFPSGMMHTMRITCLGLPRALLCLLIGASLLASSGCVRSYRVEIQQGNVVSAEQIEKITPGTTRNEVRFILGTPLIDCLLYTSPSPRD